ncbi:flavin-containing monooxygenase YUCCA9 [Favolaschia claudopus]|uniref:Flavin-containing monooxygenase YUCCA9 n=1 Tax=Favolaschia claudopus TaxID=2862362 RepID=A0AAW0BDA5_9AGAR
MKFMALNSSQVSSSWLRQFGTALESEDVSAIASCCHPKVYFRDILVFGWDNRCLHGHSKLAAYLTDAFAKESQPSITRVELDESRPGLLPEYGPLTNKLPLRAVSAAFRFSCAVGVGRGYFSLIYTESGQWKALVVMMALADIKGHEEIEHPLAQRHEGNERRAIETNPHALIIGGGQSGLVVAARFKQMNIRALVLETNYRVGDNWRKRHPSLVLHSPKKCNSMLYRPFPNSWPDFISRDQFADWLEQYVLELDLVVWTNSRPLPRPTYDPTSKKWTVEVDRAGEHLVLNPVHIVVAAGTLGAPRVPYIPSQHIFTGTAMHSSEYRDGKSFFGKRVVVVGAGNTASDLCQDLVLQGAQSVTMVQRSSTWITSRASAREMFECMYPSELDIDVCDLLAMARPLKLMQKIEKQTMAETLKEERATHRGLREVGFYLETEKTFLSLWYERLGGFWIDNGCAELIRSGKVKIKQGVEILQFSGAYSIGFTDGTSMEADSVIFATSHESITNTMRPLLGEKIIAMAGPVWGTDGEGELRGCYRPTGHPGLWFAAGELAVSRPCSKQLALQIKAIELGLL